MDSPHSPSIAGRGHPSAPSRINGGYVWAAAGFVRTMPGVEAALVAARFPLHRRHRRSQALKTSPRNRRQPLVRRIENDIEKLPQPPQANRRHNAELRQMRAKGVHQHGALTDQKRAGPVHHREALLLPGLYRDEAQARARGEARRYAPPRRSPAAPRQRGIRRVVLVPLDVGLSRGLHVRGRHDAGLMAEPAARAPSNARSGTLPRQSDRAAAS